MPYQEPHDLLGTEWVGAEPDAEPYRALWIRVNGRTMRNEVALKHIATMDSVGQNIVWLEPEVLFEGKEWRPANDLAKALMPKQVIEDPIEVTLVFSGAPSAPTGPRLLYAEDADGNRRDIRRVAAWHERADGSWVLGPLKV